ncbi:DUF1772 domain-containing protein [Deinococcus sonorensis]|uniref:DUF1772 domain-containing protein n=2 Tax=Deinococcus sonorensis TaxID=309891 RepID=A0AAU7U6V5_9DEIO
MQELLVTVTIVLVGLMVGVELSVAAFVEPIFSRLPPAAGIAARSDGARVLGRVMPFWYIGCVLLGVIWAALTWGHPQVLLIAAALALLLLSVVMSITVLVPINTRVARWAREGTPEDWQQQVRRWNVFHYARVGLIVAAFVLLVLAGLTA